MEKKYKEMDFNKLLKLQKEVKFKKWEVCELLREYEEYLSVINRVLMQRCKHNWVKSNEISIGRTPYDCTICGDFKGG